MNMEPLTCWPPEEAETTDIDALNQDDHKTNSMKTTRNESRLGELGHVSKKQKHGDDFIESFADIALARWWRSEGRQHLESKVNKSHSSNPNTQLKEIAKLPEAQDFIKSELRRLKELCCGDAPARTHAALATFSYRAGDLSTAITHTEAAIAKDKSETIQVVLHKMRKKLWIEEKQKKHLINLSQDRELHEWKQAIPVERRSGSDLTVSEFYEQYTQRGVPVIITDVVHNMTSVPWSLQHISQVAGECPVTVKKLVPGSVEWAQLEDVQNTNVAEYINSLTPQSATSEDELTYLFDWSLPIHCPKLAAELTIPKYFADDFLQRVEPGSLYYDSWPSLFIAPPNIESQLHVDAFGSNFWMALFQGRKRWIFFDKDDLPCLYPSYDSDQSTDPTFEIHPNKPDFVKYPLLKLVTPRECILQPGELLFVPAGSPHYVKNLDQTLAISSNYVDASNLSLVKKELTVNGLLHDRALNLLGQLSSPGFPDKMNADAQDVPWETFKKWPKSYDFKPLTDKMEEKNDKSKVDAYDIFCRGPLLDVVQRSGIYPDSKTFVDMHMTTDAKTIISHFDELIKEGTPTTDQIRTFVDEHFSGPGGELEICVPDDWSASPKLLEKLTDTKIRKFAGALNDLWKILGRKIQRLEHPERHSLIHVPNLFVIPGDRFREYYYWDTYWVIGGLLAVDMTHTVRGILENFLQLVDKYGFIPNGGRIYYTERSQPPLLIPMIDLYYEKTSDLDFIQKYITLMESEHDFWLKERSLVVEGSGGQLHNMARYAAQRTEPRPEGYMTDVEAAEGLSEAERVKLFSNIASACESGWDFSTRWFKDKSSFKSINTQQILPVDLNVYLCWAEKLLAKFYGLLGNTEKQKLFLKQASDRRTAIDDMFWQSDSGAWFDFDLDSRTSTTEFYASNLFPLFANCTNVGFNDTETAHKILEYVRRSKILDYPGGIPTSLITSGQQWDFPNAWSPLVHLVLESLGKLPVFEAQHLVTASSYQWVLSNMAAWQKQGHMYEKYDVEEFGSAGGGGEYNVQVGFGWTNGLILMLLDKYNDISSNFTAR